MAQKSRYANKQQNKYSNCYSIRPALRKDNVDANNQTKLAMPKAQITL